MINPKLKPYAPLGLYLALLALLSAGGMYFIWRDFNLQVKIALIVAIIGLALFIVFDPDRIRQALTGRQAQYGSNILVLVLAVAGILVVLNYLVYKNPKSWDLTEDKTNTLTEETLAILGSLDQPVKATGYFTASASYAQSSAQDILNNYKMNSNGKFSYEFVDPEANPVMAQTAGITQDRTIVLQMGDQQEAITYTSENEMTGALIRLMSGEIRSVYFLTGHGEYDIEGATERSYMTAQQTLAVKNYKIESLNLLAAKEIPADANLLVIAGPTVPLSQDEVELLAEFSQSGGALIIMQEPPVLTDYGDQPDPLAEYLEQDWGITLGNDLVVDLQLQTGSEAVATSYGVHPITQKMEGVATIYPTSRSLQTSDEIENISLTPLAMTAAFPTSWAETDLERLQQGEVEANEGEDVPGPVTLAVAAENYETGGRLVVFGDSDFASDNAFYTQRNGDMLINSADWATEQEDMINLTPREQTTRFLLPPFPAYTNLVILATVCILPALVLGAGGWVWLARRRRT